MKVIYCVLIFSILIRSCNERKTMQALEGAVSNETEYYDVSGADDIRVSNAVTDNYHSTYAGAYGQGHGGTVGQSKNMNENIKLGMLYQYNNFM
ncbi:unnamed protein product [Adineta steineri]|uniref:Uncharacterized protein n=1 Tax=Adineta steineri TaxID=433720 RepID=A0A819DMQ7_9BILA|nr:unnamed protein product [Adineta steineri]CAF1364907.1 unnamed protein product [Adineta steineri]CAF3832379.1 unnamed protein product [Adineta steineri]CAF4146784.1 unnamed protein product [Adineta steineri]